MDKVVVILTFLFGFSITLWGASLSLGSGGMLLVTGWLLVIIALVEADRMRTK